MGLKFNATKGSSSEDKCRTVYSRLIVSCTKLVRAVQFESMVWCKIRNTDVLEIMMVAIPPGITPRHTARQAMISGPSRNIQGRGSTPEH
jgi:hypothetical protein